MVCTLPILLQQPSCDDFRLCLICSGVLSATLRPKSGGDLVYRLPLNFWIDTSCGFWPGIPKHVTELPNQLCCYIGNGAHNGVACGERGHNTGTPGQERTYDYGLNRGAPQIG